MEKANSKIVPILGIIAIVFLFVIFFKNAWVCDDSYIIFRSVEQFHSGNGPVWNPGERVQGFTSPLWFLLLSLFRLISSDPFFNVMILSFSIMIFFTLALQKLFGFKKSLIVTILILLSSNAFMDFTTSGLENILVYFILIKAITAFLDVIKIDDKIDKSVEIRTLILWSSLLFVCRHDLLTLWFIPLAYTIITHKKPGENVNISVLIKDFVLAILPLVLWSVFSLYYYGTLMPNTAYAKVFTGIPRIELIAQGFKYIQETFIGDPVTILIIIAGLINLFFYNKNKSLKSVGVGILLNIIYIIFVGGDFMRGRFFGYAFLVSTILIVYNNRKYFDGEICHKYFCFKSFSLAIIPYLVLFPHTPVNTGFDFQNFNVNNGIADERGYFFDICSLYSYLNSDPKKVFPDYEWSQIGKQIADSKVNYLENDFNGMLGYWAGTETVIIDRLALTDPFLSRLPVTNMKNWRIGHFKREVPLAYRQSIASGKNCFKDSKLKKLYDLVTDACKSKKMLSYKRLVSIIELNLWSVMN